MGGIIGVEVGSRFVTDYSLSILEMHRVGLVQLSKIMSIPVISSLQNNYTVLGKELETT